MLSLFFIRRPVVALVISILIVLMGVIAYPTLPVAQYPDITPPVIQVTASYPGASAQVIADAVAAPIEQEVNGVENAIYFESTSASDGSYTLDITFELGTDIDIASVLVQNRVNVALPKLPEEVSRQGVTTKKVSSNLVNVIALSGIEGNAAGAAYDDVFLSNYLLINLNDEVKRIRGVGDTMVFPAKNYGMRIWLDPEKLKARSLTTVDVINALREQNVQVAAGTVGAPPTDTPQAFQLNVTTLGRLSTVDQFENVIVRADEGRILRVKDVARVELGGKSYDILGRNRGRPAAILIVYQAPGGNAVKVADEVSKILAAKTEGLPEGLEFDVIYDTSQFVKSAIEAVYHTFFEALALVLLVVLAFLASIRATIIPIVAIPVSIVGTFGFAALFGFSVNMPVLFGLILAIGIVVDDAIVVVENVERVMTESHLPARQATAKAMGEVFAPVVSISLVLMAVFLPTAFLPGISGQLFLQFALTIAASTFLSMICALTLTPALCGLLLKPHTPGKKHNVFKRTFDRAFNAISGGYASIIRVLTHPGAIAFTLAAFVACVLGVGWTSAQVPKGFVPLEDRGLVIAEIWLPDAASQHRTLDAVKRLEIILNDIEGLDTYTTLPGFSMINGNGSNFATMFAGLKDWDERLPLGRDIDTIMADIRTRAAAEIDAGYTIVFSLPAIDGVGNASGFDLRLRDTKGMGRVAMESVVSSFIADGNAQSKIESMSSGFRAAVPQLFADIDREKVKKLGIPLQNVFDTLGGYLGSAYVNDFNLFERTWQVTVQADAPFRAVPEDVARLEVRTPDGRMIPLGTLLRTDRAMGADRVVRFNMLPAAVVNGSPAPGVSSGEAIEIIDDMAVNSLPDSMDHQWAGISLQERRVGNQGAIVFGLAMLVVYLILAALYESWATPLSVILSIPLAVLGAMAGLMWRGMDNNIYTQVGLVLLVGLGAKNAILIVEFARANRFAGKSIRESVIDAARQRLRPILMTAFAFILGVVPLVIATGAGAASRQAIGTAVFFGMIGNTFLGLIFTPVLYVAIQAVTEKIFGAPKAPLTDADLTAPAPAAHHGPTAAHAPA
jgi:HAE1 family hydrophobic/amphiphilic exporter-1